ncbi:MAG: hypothetical protein S4CHLAM81_03610 [Chlamydiales bacterium]|nr:hypothetical protein [Chlamydiales bacterium]MCH9635150.1 hypothetical protein [Chlamydiales bacterium]MCH9704406.1 SycD/LcrH family type III secretion system chaperone [Chlamydiota bacterium]
MSKIDEIKKRVQQNVGKSFPDDFDAFVIDFAQNRLMKSETLKKAFELTDYEMEELYLEAYTLYENDLVEGASNAFRFLVILDPFTPRYWMGLGASLQLIEQYEKALKAYAMVTLIDPENPAPHLYAAQILEKTGQSQEAEIALNLAKRRQPC